MDKKNCFTTYEASDLFKLDTVSDAYKAFLSECKTERECVDFIENECRKEGFVSLEERLKDSAPLKAGDKLIVNQMGKTAYLIVIGKKGIEEGLNYIGAHIDSPRLDLKADPLYEDQGLAFFDTHYYGGIKKYQWVTIPLALHGAVAKKDGSVVKVVIGEKSEDPVFCVSDLLIHLSQEQMTKNAASVIDGEQLDVLIASRPEQAEEGEEAKKDPVRSTVLTFLKNEYNIEETDFLSAEFEVVPAGPARDLGFDRSMIMGYGHDDRCCAFTEFYALMEIVREGSIPERTLVAHLTDKEEIGSVGATGAHSRVLENIVAEIAAFKDEESKTPLELKVRRCLQNTCVLSADVSSAFDPLYASAFSRSNCAKLGYGITLLKYSGARGKSGANDANAEYIAKLCGCMDENKVNYQMAEIGRVDLGGGGTIAYIVAAYGCEVIDCGIPVMSMHSPGEVINKADLYEAVKCYKAFYLNMVR